MRGIQRTSVRQRLLACALLLLAIPFQVAALTGSEWLTSQAQPDGSFPSNNPRATTYQSTTESVRALIDADGTANPAMMPGLTFIGLETFDDTEYLARRIIVNAEAGVTVNAILASLSARQNLDGGFGDFAGYESTVTATAYALEAYVAAGSFLDTVAQDAFFFLLNAQKADGGWSNDGNESSIFLVAQVLVGLSAYQHLYDIGAQIQSAEAFLASNRTGLGDLGDTIDTAAGLLAMSQVGADRSAWLSTADYLRVAQNADGSWDDDSYTTALALRALSAFDGPIIQDPALGSIAGVIVDGVSGAPLFGVTVDVTGTGSYAGTTDKTGYYQINGVIPGAVTITTDLAGYLSTSSTGTVVAGQNVIYNAQLPRDPQPVPLTLHGIVIETATAQPISGATLAILNQAGSFSTLADGTFSLVGLEPGTVTLQISQAGFATARYSVSAPAGGVIDLGIIELHPVDANATMGVISGQIRDSLSGAALRGAVVSLSGADTQVVYTGTDGRYTLNDVPVGDVTISVSLEGYQMASVTTTIVAGQVQVFNAELISAGNPGMVTIAGTVVDDVSGTALPGAQVEIPDTPHSTLSTSDGGFQLDGIPGGSYELSISYPGYNTVRYTFTAPNGGFVDFGAVHLTSDTPVLGNQAPVIHSALPENAVIGQYYTYPVVASDADDDAMTFGLVAYPAGMSIDAVTGLIEWIPTLNQVGTHIVTVLVSDGQGGLAQESGIVTVAESGGLAYVVTDVETLNGLTVDAVVPQNYVMGTLVDYVSDQVWRSAPCVLNPIADGNDVVEAAAALDYRAVQAGADRGITFDMGAAVNSIAVFPQIDHEPFPEEGIEYTVWGSDDPAAVFPDEWTRATLVNVYARGFVDNSACAGNGSDDFAGLYGFPQDSHQFVRIMANYSITIFDAPDHKTWEARGDDAGEPGWQSFDAEIDGVGAMQCTAPPIAEAGTEIIGIVGMPISFDATGSQGSIQTYGWDIDGDGAIDVSGPTPNWTFQAGFNAEVTLYVVDDQGCVATDTVRVVVDLEYPKPDFVVLNVNAAGVVTDLNTLMVTGTVQAKVQNIGLVDALNPPQVNVFQDVNDNGRFDTGIDVELGAAYLETGLPRGVSAHVDIPVNGASRFRDAPMLVMADSLGAIPESDENNNTGSSATQCMLSPTECVLFDDNFEADTMSVWTLVPNQVGETGDWSIQNGVMVNAGNGGLWAGDLSWTNYIAETKIKFIDSASNDTALLFRYQDQNNWYQFSMRDGEIRLISRINGVVDANVLSDVVTVAPNRWYTIRVEVRDNAVSAFVDGQRIFEYNNLQLVSGAAGIMSDPGASVHYDDFIVHRCGLGFTNPVKKWVWNQEKVMSIPLVAPLQDTNGDGSIDELDTPAVIFASHSGFVDHSRARLRAVDGKTGAGIWSVLDSGLNTEGSAHPTVGDIDNDGIPEVVMYLFSGGLAAINSDGSLKWTSTNPPRPGYYNYGGLSLADLEGDGTVEILARNYVLNADGTLRWSVPSTTHNTTAVAVDLNLDGIQEVVIGMRAYTADGQDYWDNTNRPSGYSAITNLDDDDYPEIVGRGVGGMTAIDHDGTEIWVTPIPGGGGGAPTVADMDGDGYPEIGVAGRSNYVVFNHNGSILWTSRTQDYSSQVTGSTVFDFDGDGASEVVYSDERVLRVYDGRTGQTLYSIANNSATASEYPVVADIDNDGHAELLVVGDGSPIGLKVFEDADDAWVATRGIWNQYAYHIDNIADDTSIPANPARGWLTHNTFRLNTFPDHNPLDLPDLSLAVLRVVDNGETQTASLTVRIGNGGTDAVSTNGIVTFYEGDPTSGGIVLGTVELPTLLPGAYLDVELTGVSGITGAQDIYAIVDPENRIAECNEANNRMVLPVLPQSSAGSVQVVTDVPVYAPGDTVNLQAAITNTSSVAGEYQLVLQVEDAQGVVMFSTSPVVSNPVPGGAATSNNALWNSGTVLAGDYILRGMLYGIDGVLIDEDTVVFQIAHDSANGPEASLRLTTDRSIYHISDTVEFDHLVENLTTATVIGSAEIELTVTGPSGQPIYSTTLNLGQLAPGAQMTKLAPMALENAPLGAYTAEASLSDRSRNQLLATASTGFSVQDDPVKSLTGTISLASSSLKRGDTQTCTGAFINSGVQVWSAQPMQMLLVRLDNETVIGSQPFTVDLAVGGTAEQVTSHSTGTLEPAFYACILQTQLDGVWTTLDSASFEVTVPPIMIEAALGRGERGRVLALIDNVSSASGCPVPLEVGFTLSFDPVLAADGAITMSLIDAAGTAVDVESATLQDTSFPIDTSVSAVAEDLKITGFSADGLSVSISRPDGHGLAEGYRLEAVVTQNGTATTYHTDTLNYSCNPRLVIGDNSGTFQVSTLILPSENNTADPHGPDSAPSTELQQWYLENLLTQAGWSYTIVTDADAFTRELRTGGYSIYALLSEQVKLPEDVQKEVREAVFRGEGLVVAGSHDNRNHTVYDAMGIKLQGVLSDVDGVSVTDSALLTSDHLPLAYPDKVRKIDLQGAVTAGGFNQLSAGNPVAHPDGVASLTRLEYGAGHSIFIGFDLLAHGATSSLDSRYGELLLNALAAAHPATLSADAGRVVPVVLNLINRGIATAGEVRISLSAGMVIDAGSAQPISSTEYNWHFDLALDGTTTLTFYVQLPADGTDVTVTTAISTGVAPDLVPYETQVLALVTAGFPLQDAVIDLLTPLKQADKGYGQALDAFERGQAKLSGGDLNGALSDWLTATDRLVNIEEPAAYNIRTTLDELIRALEAQL